MAVVSFLMGRLLPCMPRLPVWHAERQVAVAIMNTTTKVINSLFSIIVVFWCQR